MTDLISRQMAIHVLRKMLYKLEDEREEYYIKEKKADEWFFYIRPNMQDMNDLDVEAIDSLPSANPWHTGTPTEEGDYYIAFRHFIGDNIEYGWATWDGKGWDINFMGWHLSNEILAWQKIILYQGREE